MDAALENFLKKEAFKHFKSLDENTPNTFGVMNVLQMLEHVAQWISISSGKLEYPLQTPVEHLPKWKAFLMSDKEFRPNTPNSLLTDTPPTPHITTVVDGSIDIQIELNEYFMRFKNKENETELHPFFGPLNFEEWAVLHGKHLRHHLRQFGVSI